MKDNGWAERGSSEFLCKLGVNKARLRCGLGVVKAGLAESNGFNCFRTVTKTNTKPKTK